MNVTVSESTWHGQPAWGLENDALSVQVVPSMGAKLTSLYDKRSGHEWLVDPGERPVREIPYGASFADYDLSGWDEMFPTIVACEYPLPGPQQGKWLPDHGEVWALRWLREDAAAEALRFVVRGVALDYRLARTLRFTDEATLVMHYDLFNDSAEPLAYLWSAHPQFLTGDEGRIILPAHVRAVQNALTADWGWGDPETSYAWPLAERDGRPQQMDRVGPPQLKTAHKFFVPADVPVGWVGLHSLPSNNWLRLSWDAVQIPYLGVWVDQGFLSQTSVVALEPMTGFYDSLATAWAKQKVAIIGPGERTSWDLVVVLGTADDEPPWSITPR